MEEYEDYEEEEKEIKKFGSSPFNMGVAYLERLDRILKICNNASIMGDTTAWIKGVMVLYREISPRLTEKEKEAAKKLIRVAYSKIRIGNNRMVANPSNPEMLISEAEEYLRHRMNDKNLLLPNPTDPSMILGM